MAAQASARHLQVEETPQASQDAGLRRLRMTWFFQGLGLAAALVLIGVAALDGSKEPDSERPSGSDEPSDRDMPYGMGFMPAVPGITSGGLRSRQTASSAVRGNGNVPVMQIAEGYRTAQSLSLQGQGAPLQATRGQPMTLSVRDEQRSNGPLVASPAAQTVQGGSLRTWSYRSPSVEQVQVVLGTEGRPLDADIELWHGPDNTPFKMRVYAENGDTRPFSAVLETPRGPNTIAIRNIGQLEFPIIADVFHDRIDQPSEEALSQSTVVQGGALRTFPFDPSVDSVEVLLTTDGRPLNARIELLQGPNNNKQVIELYAEDGRDRQFFAVIETPGAGNVLRIVNTAPVEFPMRASVLPHSVNNGMHLLGAEIGGDVVIGGNAGW